MNAISLIFTGTLCALISACHSGQSTSSKPKDAIKTLKPQQPAQPAAFSGYLAAIPEIKLPYVFSFKQILSKEKGIHLDTSRLHDLANEARYYEPDPNAAYAQLAAAYQRAIAYPLFKYKVSHEKTAIAYTFHKVGASHVIYYPFVELLVYDAKGQIKGRQVIASGTMDAEHAENTIFTIVTPSQVNTVNHMYEYADSTRSGEPLNHLEDKRSFYIQSDGKIIK